MCASSACRHISTYSPVVIAQHKCRPNSICKGAVATGWHIGTVQNFGVGASWKQPDATHIVRYQRKETNTKDLDGRVACKLDADNYGRSEWWLLLEPEPK